MLVAVRVHFKTSLLCRKGLSFVIEDLHFRRSVKADEFSSSQHHRETEPLQETASECNAELPDVSFLSRFHFLLYLGLLERHVSQDALDSLHCFVRIFGPRSCLQALLLPCFLLDYRSKSHHETVYRVTHTLSPTKISSFANGSDFTHSMNKPQWGCRCPVLCLTIFLRH